MKAAQPPSVTVRQIEFELEKAVHGMGMPYDAERVEQLRSMAPGEEQDPEKAR